MPAASAAATFQATVTEPAAWKGADSSVLGVRAVPLSSTSTTERQRGVLAEARGRAWPSSGASSSPARARNTTARATRPGRLVCSVAVILFTVIRPFYHDQTRVLAIILIRRWCPCWCSTTCSGSARHPGLAEGLLLTCAVEDSHGVAAAADDEGAPRPGIQRDCPRTPPQHDGAADGARARIQYAHAPRVSGPAAPPQPRRREEDALGARVDGDGNRGRVQRNVAQDIPRAGVEQHEAVI